VREDVDAIHIKVDTEGLDVVDLPVAAVGRGVDRDAGVAGATQVEHHQLALRRQPTEIAEVCRRTHWSTGQAEQRVALTHDVIGQFGPVGSGEMWHGAIS